MALLFQANPKEFLVDEALKVLPEQNWLAKRLRKEMVPGVPVYIWRSGPRAALVAIGVVKSVPAQKESSPEEKKFELRGAKFAGPQWRVTLSLKPLNVPLTRQALAGDFVIEKWKVIHGCEGTNFRVPADIAAALDDLINRTN